MADPKRLVDQCVHKGLLYLAESLQYYWPANYIVSYGERRDEINLFAENNIALHLARSFAEKGFQVWAEAPISGGNCKLDFLAYNYTEKVSVALELKQHLEKPGDNLDDIKRLVGIHKKGIGAHLSTYENIDNEMKRMYGIVAVFSTDKLADWWTTPDTRDDYMPEGRQDSRYATIGKALMESHRFVVPLKEWPHSKTEYRFCRAAYALYDEGAVDKLGKILEDA